jgi:ethanolamine utilization protein EutP (predicted NTPase)
MSDELTRANEVYISSEQELSLSSEISNVASSFSNCSNDFGDLRSRAYKSEEECAIMKRLAIWTLYYIKEQDLIVSFHGPSAASCVSATVSFVDAHSLSCTTRAQSTLDQLHYGSTCNSNNLMASYMESCIGNTCRSLSVSAQGHYNEVLSCFQQHAWNLTRHLYTASELVLLRRRYKAIVKREKEAFVVVLSFHRSDQTATLRSEFTLSEMYPFVPLSVKLDVIQGNIDIESLQKLLQKSAKVGFGYLRRTVDTISAYMS